MKPVRDNKDLADRRIRLGLTQQEVADLLCGEPAGSSRGFHFANVSRFETGARGCNSMPPVQRGGPRLTRKDYERVLDEAEKRARKSA